MKAAAFDSERSLMASELILREDGSIYHLGLKPGDLAQRIFIVGDPDRVETMAGKLDSVRVRKHLREFSSVTGSLNGKEVSVVSSGIGVDNIDIVIQEIDALFNVDFHTRKAKEQPVQVDFIRLGTCGGLREEWAPGRVLASAYAIGMEGLAWHYAVEHDPKEIALAEAFASSTAWNQRLATPYAVAADPHLLDLVKDFSTPSITLTANGFYGPQNRALRLPLADKTRMDRLQHFEFDGIPLGNFEMECAGLYLLASALGHRVLTLCAMLAGRAQGSFVENPQEVVNGLIDAALDRFTA